MNVNRRECLKYIGLLGAAVTGLSGCKLSDLLPPLPTTVKGHLLKFIQENGADHYITEEHIKLGEGVGPTCSSLKAAIFERNLSNGWREFPVYTVTFPQSDKTQLPPRYLALPTNEILRKEGNTLRITPGSFAFVEINQATGQWTLLNPDRKGKILDQQPDRRNSCYLSDLIKDSERRINGQPVIQAKDILTQLYGHNTRISKDWLGKIITPQVDLGTLENYGFEPGSSWEMSNGAVQRRIVPSKCQDSTR